MTAQAKIRPLLGGVPTDSSDLRSTVRARALGGAPAILEGNFLRILHVHHLAVLDTVSLYHLSHLHL